ncbi:MAG: hypothetical protein NW206_09200 [Hyphomonadaceae bacterium]|nr:hypothetical protein [Hyphomonadaceae bacterium]
MAPRLSPSQETVAFALVVAGIVFAVVAIASIYLWGDGVWW